MQLPLEMQITVFEFSRRPKMDRKSFDVQQNDGKRERERERKKQWRTCERLKIKEGGYMTKYAKSAVNRLIFRLVKKYNQIHDSV